MASLGKDLATIREHQKKTLEDIHDETKIPVHILQAIEDGTIFTDFEENKTYIRSYIRSYGKALKIEEEQVIEALDHYELGTYDGHLMEQNEVESFSFPPGDLTAETEKPEESSDAEQPDAERPPEISARSADRSARRQSATAPPSVSSVDWADLGRKFRPLENRSRIWIGIAVVLLVISGVIGYWFYQNSSLEGLENSDQNTPQNVSQPAIVPDSLQLNLSDSGDTTAVEMQQTQPETTQALSDTLTLLVYAAYDRLDPVRVYTDVMAEFNPYWIEEGQAFRFEFTDVVRIRGPYSRMELLMNGHPIENFTERFLTTVSPDSQYVELSRSLFEGDTMWLQPAPDSTELNFPPPSTVLDRPSFPTDN
ncbi:helix-turn-helix domain-containing protein [Halalkalibaculum sp. DA3122]|uniref:helix-turn-helix domain-containing protein n=1 Tax=unclassified Halalkalibaculum TaxID=2964617 RepID=UPI0037549882